MENLHIGSRVESDGYNATVLFVGEIPGTKGVWLGVEWDDPSRGKHDGTHEGIRYFKTKYPKSGSFIRPKKAEFGISFLKAVESRYGKKENYKSAADELFVVSENKKITSVEFIGADSVSMKQSQFSQLLMISLGHCRVVDPGRPGEIRHTVPAVEELDLSSNLFSSWSTVAEITSQLVNLHELNMSENRLSLPSEPGELSHAFCKVHTLILNKMAYTWEEILTCTQMLNNLHQLHVCYNAISTISGVGSFLEQIKFINLDGNVLKDWNEVLKLGELPCLQKLILSNMKLVRIQFTDVAPGEKTKYFPSLEVLSISDNDISEWRSINELNKLRSLKELMSKRNPLPAKHPEEDERRALIIAIIAQLELYNRSVITAKERRGAELDYLKMFGKAWREAGGHQDPRKNQPSKEFLQEHPRYQELIDKYGPPEDSELQAQTTALKKSLINVMIENPRVPNKTPIKKKLPVSMTVQKLKTLAQRLYKVDPITVKISYSSQKMPGTEIEMDSDQKEIDYYSIEDGDTIHITW